MEIFQSTSPLIVLEAALLIECGYRDLCDEFWYVHSDENVRRRRMKETRNYSDEKIDAIIRSQLSEEQFSKNSDRILENNSDLDHLRLEIQKFGPSASANKINDFLSPVPFRNRAFSLQKTKKIFMDHHKTINKYVIFCQKQQVNNVQLI